MRAAWKPATAGRRRAVDCALSMSVYKLIGPLCFRSIFYIYIYTHINVYYNNDLNTSIEQKRTEFLK